jgi:hypothetical protein
MPKFVAPIMSARPGEGAILLLAGSPIYAHDVVINGN